MAATTTDAAAKALLGQSVLRFVAPAPPKQTVAGPREVWYARAGDIFLAWKESTAQIITGYYVAYGGAGDQWLSHINSLGLTVVKGGGGGGGGGGEGGEGAAESVKAAGTSESGSSAAQTPSSHGKGDSVVQNLRFHLTKEKLVAFALSDQSRLLHAWTPPPSGNALLDGTDSTRGTVGVAGKGGADVAKMFGQHWGIWREVTATLYASDLGTFARRVRDFQKHIFMACQLFEIYFGPSQLCLRASGTSLITKRSATARSDAASPFPTKPMQVMMARCFSLCNASRQ